MQTQKKTVRNWVQMITCVEGPLISPFSNEGKNENPKSEEFSDLGDVKFTNTLWFSPAKVGKSKLV